MSAKTEIAIAGMGVLTPLGRDVSSLWQSLLRGDGAIAPARYGGFPAATLPGTPGVEEIALKAARQAATDLRAASHRRAMVLATTKGDLGTWLKTRTAEGGDGPDLWRMAGHLAHELGCEGPVFATSTACVSGSQAVIEAAELLLDDEADEALVVGVDVLNDFIVSGFASLQALSRQPARPFDADRDGLSLGEAAAAVLLRRATGKGNEATLAGWGSSNDANHISGPSRDGLGLSLAIRRALQGAAHLPVRGICGHGTATRYNDAMEAHAFHRVFGDSPPPVFGVKGALGHSLGASALLELIICALAVREGRLPPTRGFARQDFAEPALEVLASTRPIEPGAVLSTNAGFGGLNTALLVAAGGAP